MTTVWHLAIEYSKHPVRHCHQVCCMRRGHQSLFHAATSCINWYKMARVGDIHLDEIYKHAFYLCAIWDTQAFSLKNYCSFNTLRPRQDGRHFPDDILKCIFLNENVWISLTISLKCVRKVRIFHHWFRQWLGADQGTSHCLSQWWLAYWRIYASLGLNELTQSPTVLDVCGYHRCPQTLAEICRNMGICCGFRAVADREKYSMFILLSWKH